jgi:antitoxin ParD1/3/4
MPTRNVVLTDHQAQMIERLVASGRYQNASEVLREGLRLVEQREAENEARLAALRAAARVGIEDIAAGRYRSFTTADAASEHLEALTEQILTRDDADE